VAELNNNLEIIGLLIYFATQSHFKTFYQPDDLYLVLYESRSLESLVFKGFPAILTPS